MTLRDISHKPRALRVAAATASLCTDHATIARLHSGDLPEGDPLPAARIAGIQAAKATGQLIPSCHSLPLDYVGIEFTVCEDRVDIRTEVKAIRRTGVEMEALTAASIAALALYETLKGLEPARLTIEAIALISRNGGKSAAKSPDASLRAGILVLSDSVASGGKVDTGGPLIRLRLEERGVTVEQQDIIPDEPSQIESTIKTWCDELHLDLIVTTGGTGVGPRDVTPESVDRLIERRLPGVEEAMRAHGQERIQLAMLSRGIVGQRDGTIIITLPGSPKAIAESLDAIMPAILHVVPMIKGGNHGGSGYGKPAGA